MLKYSLFGTFGGCGGARLLGVHLEVPFISRVHAGAQPTEYILKPHIEYFEELQAYSGNKIKIVTLAPEQADGDFIRRLKDGGEIAYRA